MWMIGARDGALLFVAAAALIGAMQVAAAAGHFTAAAAHQGGAPPRAGGVSAHIGGLPRAAAAHSSAASIRRSTGPSPATSILRHKPSGRLAGHAYTTSHANRHVTRSSAGSLRRHGSTTAQALHSRKPAALGKT